MEISDLTYVIFVTKVLAKNMNYKIIPTKNTDTSCLEKRQKHNKRFAVKALHLAMWREKKNCKKPFFL